MSLTSHLRSAEKELPANQVVDTGPSLEALNKGGKV
jgi:hypothetical protein